MVRKHGVESIEVEPDTHSIWEAERAEELAHVFDANSSDEDSGVTDLRALLMGVGSATVQVVTTGTPEQVAAARTVLAGARRELYLILAEDEA